jgi:hypothetical protein
MGKPIDMNVYVEFGEMKHGGSDLRCEACGGPAHDAGGKPFCEACEASDRYMDARESGAIEPPPAPRCETCPLWYRPANHIRFCVSNRARFCEGGGPQGPDEYCELHPHYPAWALGEANRRLKALEEASNAPR